MYNHGIRISEKATSVAAPVVVKSGIPVVFGTAPINLVENPSANKLVYAKDYAEAVKALGYSEDFENYTLCQSIYANFKKFKCSPVIFVNVLDPEKHVTDIEETVVKVEAKQATVEMEGLLLNSLEVTGANGELAVDTDYIASFDDNGYVLITLLSDGETSLTVTGKKIDASKVTEADIIGSYDEETGVETGMELIRRVYPQFGVFPGMIVAPKYSKSANVAAVMEAKSTGINGVFSCMAIIDIDTAKATKYTDVATVKSEMGVGGANSIVLWPMVKCGETVLSYSAMYAARTQATDAENDGVPCTTSSNKAMEIDAICLADGTEVFLDETQANTLNAAGIVTAINFDGFRTWGNNTACYPTITDPKDRWISCRRFFSWWENNFTCTYHAKVDGNASYRMIEAIVDAENIKGNSYKAQGKCAGAYMEFLADENPVENIVDGHIVFRMHLAPYTPAEDILNVFEFDIDALSAAFSAGGEE